MDYQHPPDGFNYSASQFHDLPPGDGPVYAPYDLNAPPLAGDLPPGSYYGDYGDGTDENDPKRRRIARACDMCRKKKIKCDGKLPKCSHCTNYKTECIFTHVEKKRNPPKGAKYIEALENRLGRMEQLIKLSGLITEEEAGRTDLGAIERKLAEKSKSQSNKTSSPKLSTDTPGSSTQRNESQGLSPQVTNASPRESVATPGSSIDKPEGVENISDMMCSLVTNGSGETRYIGSSSALSIFSQKGIEWVNEKTGDSSFQETIQTAVNEDEKETKWMFWKPEVFGDLFMRRVFKPLPPRDEAMSLFRDFFENFNCMFPLFHEPTFMHLAEKQYSNDPYESSSWWACINVALAIAYRLRVMSNVVPQDDDQKAWLYLKNALAVLAELLMRNTDLLSVQALLGCALFMSGTANPQPSFFLVSAAIRLSHSIGLHKKGSSFNLNPVEAEQRKRVFWVAYCVDKDTCLRSGRPSAQDDDDMNVELPSENPTDNVGNIPLADGGKINLFRLMCEFALIESKVYKKLYSVEAAKQSDGELLNTIGDLDKELEDWKDRIPIDFRPEHEIKASHTPLVLNIVVLHFSYYNCLATIHRMSVHHGYWTSRLSDYAISGINARPLNPRVFSSAALCVQAARASIHLIKYIPQGDFACVWLVIYFPVSALVTIFANILQNPQDARARADVKLMELVVNFLTNIVAEEGTGSFKRMLTVCSEFTRIARVVLDRAEKEGQKRKRKVLPEEQQSLSSGQRAMAQAQALAQNVARPITPPKRHAAGGSPLVNSTTMPNAAPSINQSPLRQGSVSQPFVAGDTAMPLPFSQPPFSEAFNPDGLETTFAPSSTPTTTMSPGAFGTSFQHPFVPQDLWQMPMTFEWDMWTDLNGQGYNNMEGNDAMMSNNGMQ